MVKLTVKQQRFADEYIISGNAEQSALKAGYSKSYARGRASDLLANIGVKSYIDKRMTKLQSSKVADQQEISEFLTSVIRGEITEPLAIADGDFAQKIVMVIPSVTVRRQAAVDLGKRYGMWSDKLDINANVKTDKLDSILQQLSGGDG